MKPCYVPPASVVDKSQMTDFIVRCSELIGHPFGDYGDFDRFSVEQSREFWTMFVEWSGLLLEGPLEPVCAGDDVETATFFPSVRLNFVENLLSFGSEVDGSAPAVRSVSSAGPTATMTRRELLDRVVALGAALTELGVQPGDRVVSILNNDADSVVAVLASLRIGATFSSAAPDMGPFSILARFKQLAPTVMFAHLTDAPGTSTIASLGSRVADVVRDLPSLTTVITIGPGELVGRIEPAVHRIDDLERRFPPHGPITWQRYPFNHPLFIVFSSGTTGPPKAIVHGAGGTLLEHVKEHRLHLNLRPDDTLFFQTSAAWMMWNWQLSALASRVEIVLNSGPLLAAEQLWDIVSREKVTVFGTSPPYIQMCAREGLEPAKLFDISRLRAILSTGSVLYEKQFYWIHEHVGELPVISISGGTDILGCFLLGNPILPVYPGQLQSRSLGLDVGAEPLMGGKPSIAVGELVCRNPFPSRPLGLFGDESNKRFHSAYFRVNPGIWTHGDLVEFTEEGGARVLGRSDGVLNISGIRIGPAEIYTILQDVPEIREAMAIEQPVGDGQVSRLVLLVLMEQPGMLTSELTGEVRRLLRRRGSVSHVPSLIVEVPDLPTTYSGKRSERAVRDALAGQPSINSEALRNPAILGVIRWQVTLEDGRARSTTSVKTDLTATTDPSIRLVITAWQSVLGTQDISTDADFFELGGTSLQVMRILDVIHEKSGIRLPLSTMYLAPTPRALAKILNGEQGAERTSVVELRAGVGQPIFVLHDITGDLLYQRSLITSLTTTRPIYGLRAREVTGDHAPLTSVEAMAADYVDRVRAVQPIGHYSFIGYSFGGLVALEMARRFEAAGDDVQKLILIDTYAQSSHLIRRLQQGARRFSARVGVALTEPRTRLPRILRRQLFRHAPWLNIQLPDSDILLVPLGLPACEIANRKYRLQAYRGDVVLYVAREHRPGDRQVERDWQRAVIGKLISSSVPGDHFTLVQPPNVERLAELISAELGDGALPGRAAHRAASASGI